MTTRAAGSGGPRVPAHQVTTRNLGAAYPFVAETGLGHRGVVVGNDLLGGSFVFDPFELYEQGILSNPNLIVFGQIGRGKSAFVKTFLWRQAVFGRRAWVVDPKGEYGSLARAWGVTPVTLRPGGSIRLNPLDPGPEAVPRVSSSTVAGTSGGVGDTLGGVSDAGSPGEAAGLGRVDRRQAGLLASLAAVCMGRDIAPRERVAIDLALVTVATRLGSRHCRRSSTPCSPPNPRRRSAFAPMRRPCSKTGATSCWSSGGWCTATSAVCSTDRPPAASTSPDRSSCSTCPPCTARTHSGS